MSMDVNYAVYCITMTILHPSQLNWIYRMKNMINIVWSTAKITERNDLCVSF